MSKTSRTADCLMFAARSENSCSWRWAEVAARSMASMASAGRTASAPSNVSWVTMPRIQRTVAVEATLVDRVRNSTVWSLYLPPRTAFDGAMTSSPTFPAPSDKAAAFRELHAEGPVPLVLVNVWDAASAKLVEQAGAHALATSSSAISWSLGFPDGNQLPPELAMEALARIVAATDLPVTADVKAGYAGQGGAFDDALLERTIKAVLAAGAVGVNIEDSGGDALTDPAEQARRISIIRTVAEESGVRLFINARTDTYLSGHFPESEFEETLRRVPAYLAAGA